MFGMQNGMSCLMVFLMMRNSCFLKAHMFYVQRIESLKKEIKRLKKELNGKEFREHALVKFAFRVRKASMDVIPENPDRPEYRLTDDLRRYRRYKQGLKRYRLFFCFANQPKIILYLYLNEDKHLRKEGDKNDPYNMFKRFVMNGTVSSNPDDPTILKWITNYKF